MKKKISLEQAFEAFANYGNHFTDLRLHSSPRRMITVHRDPMRPQPRLDRDADGGMTTSVGRIREDEVLPNGLKYLLVTHNTKMGAGKGAVLVAEYLKHSGYLG